MEDIPVPIQSNATRLIPRLRLFIRKKALAYATEKPIFIGFYTIFVFTIDVIQNTWGQLKWRPSCLFYRLSVMLYPQIKEQHLMLSIFYIDNSYKNRLISPTFI